MENAGFSVQKNFRYIVAQTSGRSCLFESRRKANAERKNAETIGFVFLLLTLLCLVLAIVASPFLFYPMLMLALATCVAFASGARTWGIGAEGEETVAHHLVSLGDPYRVVHDVVLPGMKGNMDHIVLGPNGVFVIETKNRKGFITCDGDSWTQHKVGRRGTPYLGNIGSPSKQAKRYAVLLRRLVAQTLNTDVYVNSVVVFTHKDAALSIQNPTVTVLRPDELCEFVRTYRSEMVLREWELNKLEAAIRPYSQFR